VQIGQVHSVKGFGIGGAGAAVGASAVADLGGIVFNFLDADSMTKRLTCLVSGLTPLKPTEEAELEGERSVLSGLWGLVSPPPFPVGF
jgi:hypothetical protein